jgi:hypothetical protein
MNQIITGPFGRIAYHIAVGQRQGQTRGETGGQTRGQYPALNLPCVAFARAHYARAANDAAASNVSSIAARDQCTNRALHGASALRDY